MADRVLERILHRILHVDDDPAIRAIMRLVLESVGRFTVTSCASGAEAVAKAPGFRPDLILLDVMMPGMSGPQTLRRLRMLEEVAQTPVVLMTARDDMDDASALRAMGVADVIAKPFEAMRVCEQIQQIWSRHACHG